MKSMRKSAALIAVVVLGGVALYAFTRMDRYTVHEWGTFTCVSGSDGELLTGLEREEHALPPFVLGHGRGGVGAKGWLWPVEGVTVKMETPVLYFYSDRPRTVDVTVGFEGGSISQWYPERTSGESVAVPPQQAPFLRKVDFSRGYRGSAAWKIDVLPREPVVPYSAPSHLETPEWPRARVPEANRIRGVKGEVEHFVFYRGLGNFALPLRVTATEHGVALQNSGADEIPFALVYERTDAGMRAWWSARLAPHSEPGAISPTSEALKTIDAISARFVEALVDAGLTASEARAMLATWRESYFERPGLRVFWIVPRAFTDRVLPIALSPAPAKLERVLVGRTEILTPRFEAQLHAEFAADGGKRWANDRYFLAYRERVGRLQRAVAVAAPPASR